MDWSLITLRVFAVLMGVRALTDVFKPVGAGSGLVFFGKLLTGLANWILAPLVGIYLLIYVYGVWNLRRFALPMGIAYVIYVAINLTLFPVFQSLPPDMGIMGVLVYAVVALGVSGGTVWLLSRRRAELR